MEDEAYFLRLLCVILLLQTTLVSQTKSSETDLGCESPTVLVIAVEQTRTGVRISATSALDLPDSVEGSVITGLPGAIVPQEECGQDYSRCPLECGKESGNFLCQLPIRNGGHNCLALVKFKPTSEGFQEREQVCLRPKASCVPLQVFKGRFDLDPQYFVPCLNITSADHSSFLYFEQLKLFKTNLTLSTLDDSSYISSDVIGITREGLSRLVYRDSDRTHCFPKRNVFFKHGPQVIQFQIFDDGASFNPIPTPIENCPNTDGFNVFEPDQLRIQCSSDDIVIHDPCNTESVVDRYDTTINATVFQCTASDINVFHFQGHLIFEPYGSGSDDVIDDVMLPFNDTRNIQCAGRGIPTLFITRSNGETYLVNPPSSEVHYLAANTCGLHSCPKLNVLEVDGSTIVGLFDYSNNTYTVLNLTCPDSPVVSRIRYANPPILFSLVPSGNTQPCPLCASDSSDIPLPTNPTTPNPDETGSPSLDTPTNRVPQLAENDNRGLFIGVTTSAVAVFLLIVVTMTLVIVVFAKK